MNWYFKTILSQAAPVGSMAGYLGTLGIGHDVLNYILSLDIPTAQFLTNEVRKDPGLTVVELQQMQLPQKQDPYSAFERKTAGNYPTEMQQWILVNMRRMRRGVEPNSITDEMNRDYAHFAGKLDEVRDWFQRSEPKPELASYDAFQAIQASDEWHRMMSGQGEGKIYENTKPESIVYGPQWTNPEWNGWTIQRVESENDLLAEGNKMNHCVGSYCSDVERGYAVIYSLRDPKNHPFVTIETDGMETVRQIQGHSNHYPDEDYIRMIYEWVNHDPDSPKRYDEGGEAALWALEGELDDIAYRLRDLISGYVGDEDYGIGEACGLETASNEFREWQQNFDVEKLMEIVMESAEYSHYGEPLDPEKINWDEESSGIATNLLEVIEHFDDEHEPYKKLLIQILKEEANRPYELAPVTDEASKIRASFAQYVLNIIKMRGTEESQMELDFSYASKKTNWYKRTWN